MSTPALGLPHRTVDFTFRVTPIALVLFGGLILRLGLASLPGFDIDISAFSFWSAQLADSGPWNFYIPEVFADYTPGYLYVLWLLGGLDKLLTLEAGQFEYLLKLPPLAADLASAYLLYRLLEGRRPILQLGAAAVYLLHPAVLLIGPVWGQADSLLAFFLLLTVYLMAKGRPLWAAAAYTVAFLVKPQAVAALPLIATWLLRDAVLAAWRELPSPGDAFQRALQLARGAAARLMPLAAAVAITALLLILPFFPDNPFQLADRLEDSTDVYPYDTFFAYNFWGVFSADRGAPGGVLFSSDDATFWGVEHRAWGFALFGVASLAIVFVFGRARTPGAMAFGVALSVFAFFALLTRMHERYLFPFFLLFLAACVIYNQRTLWVIFLGLSAIHFFNLYYVYSFPQYTPSGPAWELLFVWIEDKVFIFSLLTALSFPLLLAAGHLLVGREGAEPEAT